jgi:hypothetical protein
MIFSFDLRQDVAGDFDAVGVDDVQQWTDTDRRSNGATSEVTPCSVLFAKRTRAGSKVDSEAARG